MKKKSFAYFCMIGLVAILFGCEKEMEKVILSDETATKPTLAIPSDLTLLKSASNSKLTFTCTPLILDFSASTTHYLEAALGGSDFAGAVQLYSGSSMKNVELTVSALNSALQGVTTPNTPTSMDFRVRAVVLTDAGEGKSPVEYMSETVNATVTLYALANMALINETTQSLTPGAKGYEGIVKLSKTAAFTLYDSISNVTYATLVDDTAIVENGAGISVDETGWYHVTVNVENKTIQMEKRFIGVIGSATASGWDSPDNKMEYDPATGTWSIAIDLVATPAVDAPGRFKFRMNDEWAWNMGGSTASLKHDGSDIKVTEDGNYTIVLTVTNYETGKETGSYTITKN